MERKKQRISDLFYDNRFLMAFSVLFAIIAWLIVATEFSETQNTIRNIPVQIDYSNINNSGLQTFLDKDYTVDVTIKGKRYIVESDNIKDDILVVADTSLINNPGKYTLNLTVTSKSVRPEYDFVSVSPQVTEKITFDYFDDREIKIEPDIKGGNVREGYLMGEKTIQDYSSKAIISGPKSDVDRVSRVFARAEIDGDLDQSTTIEADLIAVDKNGEVVQGVGFKISPEKVSIKINVYYEKELPVSCSFSGIPTEIIDNIPYKYSVSPSPVLFGIVDENIDRKSVEMSRKIDFSELHEGLNEIPVDVSETEFSGAELLDKNTTRFVVTVNVTDVSRKTFTVKPENIKIQNCPDGVEPVFSNFRFSELTVIGPPDKLEQLTNENIVLIADFGAVDELEMKDAVFVPVSVYDGYCWSYGQYYADYFVN